MLKRLSESVKHEDAHHTCIDQSVIQANEMWILFIDGLYKILSGCMYLQVSTAGMGSLKFTVRIFAEISSMRVSTS